MAALTKDRNTPMRGEKTRKIVLKMAGTTKIYAGAGVCANATGFAVPAADTAGLVTMGRAEAQVDNSAGADGDLEIEVSRAVFLFNHTGMTQANVGRSVVWLDDNTVGLASAATNDIPAGILDELDAGGGAWVEILP